jgi:hypothetical protein
MNTMAQALRDKAAQHDQDAADSFERCDTDGFLSQWASGINAQKARMEATLVEAGGVATFTRWELTDLDGNTVPAKLIDGRYGECWALTDAAGKFTGTFVSAFPKRAATMERKGFREVEHEFVAPAHVQVVGSHATNVHPRLMPDADADGNYPEFYGSIGAGDLTGEAR